LIFLPEEYMQWFGFKAPADIFLLRQDGVTFYLLAIGYLMVGIWSINNRDLLIVGLTAKFIEIVFLFSFYFHDGRVWAVLLCALIDSLLELALLWCYLVNYRNIGEFEFDQYDFNYDIDLRHEE